MATAAHSAVDPFNRTSQTKSLQSRIIRLAYVATGLPLVCGVVTGAAAPINFRNGVVAGIRDPDVATAVAKVDLVSFR